MTSDVRRPPLRAQYDGDPFYKTKVWKALRGSHLRGNPYCVICSLLGYQTLATVVDHIISRAKGGSPTDPNNLQSLCSTHHSSKTIRLDRFNQHTNKFSNTSKTLGDRLATGPDGFPIKPGGDRR